MAKPYSPTNLREYDLQFEKVKSKLVKGMAMVLRKTAETCLEDIVNHEPAPYRTGSYIASHRVGINTPDSNDTVVKEKGGISLGSARAQALSQKGKLKGVKATDTIYISNSVGYSTKYGYSWARNVEYAGWNGKGPYLVYEQAALKALQNVSKYAALLMTTEND